MTDHTVLATPSSIRGAIRAALSGAAGRARIAVPFWGADALDLLDLAPGRLRRLDVICNLQSGLCSPKAIEALLESGAQVRSQRNLHAKLYLGPCCAVVGSANASLAALGTSERSDDDHAGWDELCVRLERPAEIASLSAWFARQWQRSIDLRHPVLGPLLLAQARKAYRPDGGAPVSLVDELLRNPRAFDGERLFVALDWETYSPQVEAEVEQANADNPGLELDAWEDWTAMPGNAEILSFQYTLKPRPRVSYDGCYCSPPNPRAAMNPHTRAILVLETRKILGTYVLSRHDIRRLTAAAVRMNEDRLSARRSGRKDCLQIGEFAARYLA